MILAKHPKSDVCSADQKRFLLNEIGRLHQNCWDFQDEEMESQTIRDMRRRYARLSKDLEKYDKAKRKRAEQRAAVWNRRVSAAKQAIFFSTPDKALLEVNLLISEFAARKKEK